MNRLTKIDDDDRVKPLRTIFANHGKPCEMCCHLDVEGTCRGCPIQEAFDKLGAYEDAEEQGRLFTFPFAIGDTVYEIWPYDHRTIATITITGFEIWNDSSYGIGRDEDGCKRMFNLTHDGDSVFRTREEAEARLKEMEGGNG